VPESGIGRSLQSSSVLRWLDSTLPPVPDVMARLGRITDPLGFPLRSLPHTTVDLDGVESLVRTMAGESGPERPVHGVVVPTT
jgi:hypothetical protein